MASASRCMRKPAPCWKRPATRSSTWPAPTACAAASPGNRKATSAKPGHNASASWMPCCKPAAAAWTPSIAIPAPAPCACCKTTPDPRLDIYEPVRFIQQHLLPRLEITPQTEPVAVHVTCSTQHLGQAEPCWTSPAAAQVIIPEGIHCCGFAGDKGFTTPAEHPRPAQPAAGGTACSEGLSTSRTCEIGLSQHGGYRLPQRGLSAGSGEQG